MASLKEVKARIVSVGNTQKITQAMKMVASAKLHRAQSSVERIRMYKSGLESLLLRLNSYGVDLEIDLDDEAKSETTSKYMGKGEVGAKSEVDGKVAIVVMSSNTGMCGAFNSNVVRRLNTTLQEYQKGSVMLFPVGKKIRTELLKQGYKIEGNYDEVANRPTHEDASALSSRLMELFLSGEVNRVDIIYHRFESLGVQRLRTETYLPFQMPEQQRDKEVDITEGQMDEYFFEPGRDKIIELLIPKVLHVKLYNALLDAYASEHGARMVAMQTASDNANEILEDLRMEFNKLRQAGITSELLDIIGGSFA